MVYPPASQTKRFGPVPNGVVNTPEAATDTAIAPAKGLMPAAWQVIIAMGNTNTVAEELRRNWVRISINKVIPEINATGGRPDNTGFRIVTKYSAAPVLTSAVLKGKIPPTKNTVTVLNE